MFLASDVPDQTFSRLSEKTGRPIVDTRVLPTLLEVWESRQRGSDLVSGHGEEHVRHRKSPEVTILLAQVLLECSLLDKHTEPSRSVSLAISILVETLSLAIFRVSQEDATESWKIWSLGHTPLLEDRMVAAGWCPFQAKRLRNQYRPSTMYYLSSLPTRSTFGGVEHSDCTTDKCLSDTVDPSTYRPRHTCDCASGVDDSTRCQMVSVSTSEVAEIIVQGGLPLIQIQIAEDGGVQLKVVKHCVSLRYVAISHVWSGGLGNVTSNAMRSCQLRYLYRFLLQVHDNGDDDLDRRTGPRKYDDACDDLRARLGLKQIQRPLLLWVDTLCVPVGASYGAAYVQAIYRMAQIYVSAQCVLVVDPELQKMDHRTMADEQIFAHVLCSSWMSRSWTFQEACMSRIWYVLFNDGYCAIDKLWHKYCDQLGALEAPSHLGHSSSGTSVRIRSRTSTRLTDVAYLMGDVSRWFSEMPVMLKIRMRDPRELMSKTEDWKNFTLAWNGLRDRSTTKLEDLDGIAAVVSDLSATDILQHPRTERMKALLRSQSTLPLPLLYQSTPKIPDESGKESWAPAAIRGDRLDLQHGVMFVESDRLLIDPCRFKESTPHRWPQAYLVERPLSLERCFRFCIPGRQGSVMIRLPIEKHALLQLNATTSLICIIDNNLLMNINNHNNARGESSLALSAPGVCLKVASVVGSTFETEYLCPVEAIYQGSRSDDQIRVAPEIRSLDCHEVDARVIEWKEESIAITSGE
ncbi:MAG: hypothetical protein Q9181_007052 [Wetmoreana brouardii]